MTVSLLLLVCRKGKKLIILIVCLGIVFIGLWSVSLLERNHKVILEEGPFANTGKSDKTYRHAYLLQRIISQANRVLNYQKDKKFDKIQSLGPKQSKAGKELAIYSGPAVGRYRKKIQQVDNLIFEGERLKTLESQQKAKQANMDELIFNWENERNNLNPKDRLAQYRTDLQQMGVPAIADLGPTNPHVPQQRIVHLDLKGAPPKISFLKRLVPVLRTLGATGLLIEYEDMFPFDDILQPLAARNAYRREELKDFLETAAIHNLSIIPLVQTFGHLEYILKLPGFETLREIRESPQSICPSKPDAIHLVENILKQVIDFHLALSNRVGIPNGSEAGINFTHIHIGCDEVFRMADCKDCRQRMRNEIFLTHVTNIANYIRTHWPHLHVIIWDDMLREISLTELIHSQIGTYVEPMIWVYANDIYHFIPPHLWDIYSKVFPTAWAASAYKGAFGESLLLPPLQNHLENNLRWLAVMAKEGLRFTKGFRGLTLTGWQRYDHFAILCELLPVSMPSLIISLSTVSRGFFETNPKENFILRVIECIFHPTTLRTNHPWLELQPNSPTCRIFTVCTYLGSHLYQFMIHLFDKLEEATHFLKYSKSKSGWFSDYNIRHNFSSPLKASEIIPPTQAFLEDLALMARDSYKFLSEFYDDYTCAEFIEQHVYPSIMELRYHLGNMESVLMRRAWPQRPLPITKELYDLNLIPNNPIARNDNKF